jgi:hypothetical protein
MGEQVPALRIFCGYAHEDHTLFQRLKTALTVLIRQEAVSVWHYGDLLPGAQWEGEIERELNTADIILLLISPAFVASDYCWDKEMRWAITRHTIGEARVIPILLKPTPGWETTPIGTLQALPARAQPITTWDNRDQAFANIARGITRVIQQMQHVERYPVHEYGLAFDYYTSMNVQTQEELAARERAMHQKAEQWLVAVQDTGGTLQEVEPEQAWWDSLFVWKKWYFTLHHLHGYVYMRSHKTIFTGHIYYPIYLRVTTPHAALLDHFIHRGQLPYKSLQWMLANDLDLADLQTEIYEQTGRLPLSSSHISRDAPASLAYLLYEERKNHGVRVSFASQTPRSLAKVRLTHDAILDGPFYRAHERFSVRIILSILRGEIPYRNVVQLIEEACTP